MDSSNRLGQILEAKAPRVHYDDLTAQDWVALIAEAVKRCKPGLKYFPEMIPLQKWIIKPGLPEYRREAGSKIKRDCQFPESLKCVGLLRWGGKITRQEGRFDPPPTSEELRLLVSDKGDLILLSVTCTWVIRYNRANRNREVKHEKVAEYKAIPATSEVIQLPGWRPERFAVDAKVNFFLRIDQLFHRNIRERRERLGAVIGSWRKVDQLKDRLSCIPRQM